MTEETSSTSSGDNASEPIELEVPIYIELKQSLSATDLGTFSRIEIGADQFLGSYKGKHRKSIAHCADPNYVWTILSSRQMPLFYIDASDPSDSNWLRFIRSTGDPNKYNVICMQQNQQINYFTFRTIRQGEELLTFLPGRKKKPRNKAYANLSFRLCEPADYADLAEYAEEKGRQEPAGVEEDQEAVEIKLCDEVKKKEDYFFCVNFSLKLKNVKKPVKRQLIKCDLCTYAFVIDSRCDYDRLIKSHVIDNHLSCAQEERPVDEIVEDVCEWMIKQLENPAATENTFDCYFKFAADKTKHDLLNNNLQCFYCSYETQCDHDSISVYFKHLAKFHQRQIQQDQLISRVDENTLVDHDLSIINWSDYFRLSYKDNKFPSDKYKASKTWTCQLCKKQFDQRIDLSKHQCIELNLKLLKKKKELRKKKWKETHWKRKIDLSYIETSSLSQLGANVCDNLAFCVDGTRQDLKSYSKEVKDYLNSHLNKESQIQMVLKCCFPQLYTHILGQLSNLNESNAARLIQQFLINESASYFTRSIICPNCSAQFSAHTTHTDHKNACNDGPMGYVSCDLVAYLLNVHWDSHLMTRCPSCGAEVARAVSGQNNKQCLNENKEAYEIVDGLLSDLIEGVRTEGMKTEEVRVQKKRLASEHLDQDEVAKKRAVGGEARPVRRTTRSSIGLDVSIDVQPQTEHDERRARASSRAKSRVMDAGEESVEREAKKEVKSEFMSVKVVNNKKIHTCDKCDLEFTSSNSVTRHQEKSCLRVKVISFESKSRAKSKAGEIKKKCPICGFVFSNTHQLSIHIYRQHKSLLGSASEPPADEAVRLNQEQVKKLLTEPDLGSDDESNQDLD